MATFLMICFSYKDDATNTLSLDMANISMLNKGKKLHLQKNNPVFPWKM